MSTNRPRIPVATETMLLESSRRICALCFGLHNDSSLKAGQIAHLNRDRGDNRFENLVWLCFEHHDSYDSKTSQSKNFTIHEVRNYRDRLYSTVRQVSIGQDEIAVVRAFLRENSQIFTHIFENGSELAYAIDSNVSDSIGSLVHGWRSHRLRSFSSEIQASQDGIIRMFAALREIYVVNMYDLVGNYIKFDSKNFSGELLRERRERAEYIVSEIYAYHSRLVALAS